MPKKPQPLTRKGDKKQKTKQGLEIPVPEREDVFDALKRGASSPKRRGEDESERR